LLLVFELQRMSITWRVVSRAERTIACLANKHLRSLSDGFIRISELINIPHKEFIYLVLLSHIHYIRGWTNPNIRFLTRTLIYFVIIIAVEFNFDNRYNIPCFFYSYRSIKCMLNCIFTFPYFSTILTPLKQIFLHM
jgi:hypothetical protein